MSTQLPVVQKINYVAGLIALIILIAVAAFGIQSERPPKPITAEAATKDFSSARAMSYLRHIAQEPHATGTDANAKVRQYLLTELKALGLTPQIQSGMGTYKSSRGGSIAMVHNILVRIPGQIPGKALLLAAHYDSVPGGAGAADDGASVAAILETIRALQSGAPLQNDLICLFTDGEEAGLLGSELFTAENPWVKDIGLALNFEYRGNGGPVLMFETSIGNGELITGFANSVTHPVSNSLLYEVYKLMPNDTDFTNFKAAGIPGMNFAAIENPSSYHTQLDRPELLNEGTLQHQGDMMLPLVRYFGNRPLIDLKSSDHVYFNVPGHGLIHYPVSWVFPLFALVIVLFMLVLIANMKKAEVRLGRMFIGALAFVLITMLLAGVCHLLWGAATWLHPSYQLLQNPYNSHWYLLAFVALVIGFFGAIQSGLARWLRPLELGLGAMLCWIVLLVASGFLMPGASFVLTWPLLAVLVAHLTLCSERIRNTSINTKMWILLVGTLPAVMLFAPLIRMLFIGLSPQMSAVIGLVVTLLLGIIAQLLALLTRRFLLPALPVVAGVAFLAAGSLTANFDIEHPRPSNVFYALDGVTNQALWLSDDVELSSWSKNFFPQKTSMRAVPEIFGEGSRSHQYWTSAAPDFGVPVPGIDVLQDVVTDNLRNVVVQIKSARHAPRLYVTIEGQEVLNSHVQGQDFSIISGSKWRLRTLGMPDDGINIALQFEPGKSFKIRVLDETYGLPQAGFPVRPPEIITKMSGSESDTILTVQVKQFN
ncbi:M28 family peptidase [Solimicrobium silvestre]|uniref:Vacuolar membrane protease n=1 Tax=Solimicrobium silvestre TaxID=2099400 RepID=A0A2S9GX73_9BURK|nr:M28 family peptidase [Solimicrobium silvestre]PRC92319.1 Peptidase family M28 [Solimicrobium silvestre]